MKISRRRFVSHSSGLLFSLNPFLSAFADQNRSALRFSPKVPGNKKVLVLIHLAGGNDWLNTIIPYQLPDYYQSRPTLAIPADQVLPLNNQLALHPAMSAIKTLYDQQKMAILMNIAPAESSLSHHKSSAIWQSADSDQSGESWLGRYVKLTTKHFRDQLIFPAINVEPYFPQLRSPDVIPDTSKEDQIIISRLSNANNFAFNLDIHYQLNRSENQPPRSLTISRLATRRGAVYAPVDVTGGCKRAEQAPPLQFKREVSNQYPDTGFASALQLIANLIKQNHNATIYNISLGGFDTHTNQSTKHSLLLKMFSEAVVSFQQDIETSGFANQVVTLVQSEFGRHLKENDQQGTDHGFTSHALLIGNTVKGGLYGSYDSLIYNLNDQNQDKRYCFDYRSAQASVLENWLDCQSTPVVGKRFALLNVV